MSSSRFQARFRGGFVRLVLAARLVTMAAAAQIPIAYCASINTATMSGNSSIYQSDGLCHDFCLAKNFALAVVQSSTCWCSNYVPDQSDQVSIDNCQSPCPGYPPDVCGGDGTFGYMTLSASPSGTTGGFSATPSSSSLTQSTASVTSTPKSSTSSSTSTSTSGSSSSLPSGMTTGAPTITTVTTGGTVRTVTVTPTVPVGSVSSNGVSSSSRGLSTGAAVGIAVGIVSLVAILAGVAIFLFLRRRRDNEAGSQYDVPSVRGSSSGMMNTTPKTEMSESRYAVGPDGRSMPESWDTDGQGRRRSRLMPVDPRMDPFGMGIYGRDENKSHDSINSLRDDQDYSRRVHEPPKVLRAVNPDPDADP